MSKELNKSDEIIELLKEQNSKGSIIQISIDGQVLAELATKNKVKLSDVEVGKIIVANGNKYKILDHFEDGTTLIVSDELMLERIKFDDSCRNYNKSSLKKKIEEKCQPIFELAFGKENLVEHEVDLTSVDMQNEFGKCKCKVRPLTFDEARKYNNLLVKKDLKSWYWTLTPWSVAERGWDYSLSVVSPSGSILSDVCYFNYGVRPFCILKSNIFVSLKDVEG